MKPMGSIEHIERRRRIERASFLKTHKDYRTQIDGRSYVMVLGPDGGSLLQPLDEMTDDELRTYATSVGVATKLPPRRIVGFVDEAADMPSSTDAFKKAHEWGATHVVSMRMPYGPYDEVFDSSSEHFVVFKQAPIAITSRVIFKKAGNWHMGDEWQLVEGLPSAAVPIATVLRGGEGASEQAQVVFDGAAERRARILAPIDTDAVTELDLYLENTGSLYPMKQNILRALTRKRAKKVYDSSKALIAWGHWVEAGARSYAKEFAKEKDWAKIFPKPVRDEVARRLEERYRDAPPEAAETSEPTEAALKKVGCVPEVKLQKSPGFAKCMGEWKKFGHVDTPAIVSDLPKVEEIRNSDQEHFLVLLLDVRNHLKGIYVAALGQQSRVGVGLEEVMKVVLESRASAFIVVHNHPSGDPHPSEEDKRLTAALTEATKPYGSITLLDHVIVGTSPRFYSLREHDPKLFKK